MASVLETFIFMFEADVDDVKKGTEKAKKTTDDLNTSLKKTDLTSQKLGSSFSGLIARATGAFAAILSTGAIIAGIRSAAHYADEIGKLSEVLDINIGDVDAWTSAVKKSGGSAESFASSARSLNASMAEFAAKGTSRAAPFFEALGISLLDTQGKARKVVDVLPELADKFSKLSRSEALGIGQKIGLDQSTVLLLTKGKTAVDEIIKKQKELGVVTKKDAEIAEKFNDQIEDTSRSFKSLFTVVGSVVLPGFTSILKAVETVAVFMRENSTLIEGALIGIGTAIALYVLPPLAATAFAAFITAAPFLLIGAAVAALVAIFALLYEDITAFLNGADSLTGKVLKKFPIIGEVVKGIIGFFKQLISFVKEFIDLFGSFTKVFTKLKDLFTGDNELTQNIVAGKQAIELANSSPLAPQSTTSIVSASRALTRNTDIKTGDIIINTQATSAEGIASAIGTNLEDQMRSVLSVYDDGVAA